MTARLVAISVALVALAAVATSSPPASLCLPEDHGCSSFCGYRADHIGGDVICALLQPALPHAHPVTEDEAEYCGMVAQNHGCDDACGFKFDANLGRCAAMPAAPITPAAQGGAPIIGGSGKYRFQYMPDLLKMPGASIVNAHGLATDQDKNIYLTYQNDGKDRNCLIRWNPDGTGGEFMTRGGDELCTGTPHGLKITTEGDQQFFYHANNNQKLSKTTLNGTVVWQTVGNFGQSSKVPYRPTWFATPPASRCAYLCDGYGSNNVYAFEVATGKFTGNTWGGPSPTKGPAAPHGTFLTNHGCTWDPRANNTIVVSDRLNSRFEFFHYDPDSCEEFEWYATANMQQYLGKGTLPCNLRMYPELGGIAIMPDLSGPVAVLNSNNEVVSVVRVSELLASEQHKHPHDAIFLPNGDMVVATWNPGRVSYWKKLPAEENTVLI